MFPSGSCLNPKKNDILFLLFSFSRKYTWLCSGHRFLHVFCGMCFKCHSFIFQSIFDVIWNSPACAPASSHFVTLVVVYPEGQFAKPLGTCMCFSEVNPGVCTPHYGIALEPLISMNFPTLSGSLRPFSLVFWIKSQGFSFSALLCTSIAMVHPEPSSKKQETKAMRIQSNPWDHNSSTLREWISSTWVLATSSAFTDNPI